VLEPGRLFSRRAISREILNPSPLDCTRTISTDRVKDGQALGGSKAASFNTRNVHEFVWIGLRAGRGN
jgi:hypothetical protein